MAFGDTLDRDRKFPNRCRICAAAATMTEAEATLLAEVIADPNVTDRAVTDELIASGYLPAGTDYQPVRRHRVNGH